jgi:hypothetical protein
MGRTGVVGRLAGAKDRDTRYWKAWRFPRSPACPILMAPTASDVADAAITDHARCTSWRPTRSASGRGSSRFTRISRMLRPTSASSRTRAAGARGSMCRCPAFTRARSIPSAPRIAGSSSRDRRAASKHAASVTSGRASSSSASPSEDPEACRPDDRLCRRAEPAKLVGVGREVEANDTRSSRRVRSISSRRRERDHDPRSGGLDRDRPDKDSRLTSFEPLDDRGSGRDRFECVSASEVDARARERRAVDPDARHRPDVTVETNLVRGEGKPPGGHVPASAFARRPDTSQSTSSL